jgi:hypothetical protein
MDYLFESLCQPWAQITAGFADIMPPSHKMFDRDLLDLIVYFLWNGRGEAPLGMGDPFDRFCLPETAPEMVFQRHCSTCHRTTPELGGILPTYAGVKSARDLQALLAHADVAVPLLNVLHGQVDLAPEFMPSMLEAMRNPERAAKMAQWLSEDGHLQP